MHGIQRHQHGSVRDAEPQRQRLRCASPLRGCRLRPLHRTVTRRAPSSIVPDGRMRMVCVGEVRRPIVHQAPPTLEQVRPGVGRLDLVLDDMRQRGLDHFARMVGLLCCPVPERRPETNTRSPRGHDCQRHCQPIPVLLAVLWPLQTRLVSYFTNKYGLSWVLQGSVYTDSQSLPLRAGAGSAHGKGGRSSPRSGPRTDGKALGRERVERHGASALHAGMLGLPWTATDRNHRVVQDVVYG